MMSFGAMANTRSSDLSKKQRAKGSRATAQLEVESRRMEERLQVLKQMMSAEKARREVEGGYLWKSGQKGPLLLPRNKDQSPASNVKATGVVNSNGKQRQGNKEKIKVRILTDKNEANSPGLSIRCGQCDKSKASLSCVECVENYCQLCYAKFHQKGALALHRARPIVSKSKVRKISPEKQATTTSTVEAFSKKSSSTATNDLGHPPPSKPNETSLLSGSYDEEESAASFQQALAEWRAKGKTTSSSQQAYSSKDSSTSCNSSAGIQAGPAGGATAAVDKERPQIQFSGKSGVTYFEQLVIKRHRYDPICLSRAATHLHHAAPPRNREDISLESTNDRDLPTDEEGTFSKYNFFHDPERAESKSPHNDSETEEYTPPTPPAVSGSSSVEIVEMNVSPSTSSAKPDAVKIHPIELEETSAEPAVAMKPKSKKTGGSTRVRPKSTNKKRIQSSRLKSAPKPRCSSARSHRPSPKAPPSQVKQSDIQASVKQAWNNCSEQTQLTQFFLHGVEVTDDDKIDSDAKSQTAEMGHKVAIASKLSSTIWLPGNSICSNLDALEINPDTDLPPAVTTRPKSQNKCPPPPLASAPLISANSDSSRDNPPPPPPSDSDNEDLAELELSVTNIEEGEITLATERQERDELDEEALESLAWELASTVECEGRLTRCQSEIDKLDDEIRGDLQREKELNEEGEVFVLSDLSKVLNEFELYQQSVMEQDSD